MEALVGDRPGTHMLEEILEQPQRVADAFAAALSQLDALAAAVREASYVVLLGRGSSRSAATYGAHALRTIARRPAFLASPAQLGWGDWPLPLEGAVAVAISQSGRSREMVAAAERARERGARLLVVTNTSDSELARLADRPEDVLDCRGGTELAVPATKSFTTSIACLLAIASAHAPRDVERAAAEVPELVRFVLDDPRIAAVDLSGAREYVLTGEDYAEAVAEEGAIKLRETLRLSVVSLETSEFLHGSVNTSRPGTTVVTVGADAVGDALAADVARGAGERGARVVHVGAAAPATAPGDWIPIPACPPAWVAFAAIVPIQLAARAIALSRGLDPDRPAGLSKVTLIGEVGAGASAERGS